MTGVQTCALPIFYVVTEHGIAELFGKCLRDRAKALISIAAPQFREDLERDFFELYKKSGI